MHEIERRIAVGKELLLDLAEHRVTNNGAADQRKNDQPTQFQRGAQHGGIAPEERAIIPICRPFFAFLEKVMPQKRGRGQGQHPGQQQRIPMKGLHNRLGLHAT